MPHSPSEKKRAINRLRRIRGQTEALERAIIAGANCGDVLQQLAAVRGGVNSLMQEVLQGHLRETFECTGDFDDVPPEKRQMRRAIDEVVTLVRSYLK